MRYTEMLNPTTMKFCNKCFGMVGLQYAMTDNNIHISATAVCKRCGSMVGIVTRKENGMYDENAIRTEIEAMIYRRLSRTDEWARDNFNGDPDELEMFVLTARNEVLMGIGKAFRDYAGITPTPEGNPLN
ncbi:MAG: hypothetical protein U5R49_21950 [Deltaproteobacteria bacterium]|nr:hypothetical protein [Deltaproteobacteria bacterium]